MISKIHIQNIGIIEDIELDFNNGLNILTGETGSGKSLIIDSINLVTGNKINRNLIKDGQNKAFIEICFLDEIEDISEDGMIILSREIFTNGKNTCKLNGKMVTLTYLKSIGDRLIDIHGQHDIVNLLNPSEYINILDSYIGDEIKNIKKEYLKILANQKQLNIKRKELCSNPIERQRKLELLKYQYNEIKEANLKEGEEEDLSNKKNIFQNYEKIYLNMEETYKNLKNNILDNINNCINKINKISNLDQKYEKINERLKDAYFSLQEVNNDILENILHSEFNEEEKEKIFERLDYIFNLKRKYGNNIKEILLFFEKLSNQIQEIENSDEIINKLNKEYEENKENLFCLSLKMHNIRVNFAKKVQNIVNEELKSLEMPKAKFEIMVDFNNNEFEYDKDKEYIFNQEGLNIVEFTISTNVGSKMQMINKIASGGELSRLTLALKTVLVNSYKIPTIIFDEIDTGLSGQASIAVGQKMKVISKNHQVIAITHNANIAALGSNNILVEKTSNENTTKTMAKILKEEEKIKEIARILGGKKVSFTILEHAKELVNLSKK